MTKCEPRRDGDGAELLRFDGSCLFLMCPATGPHAHPICLACGTVQYANLFCYTCRKRRPSMPVYIATGTTS